MKRCLFAVVIFACILHPLLAETPKGLPIASPADVALDPTKLQHIDEVVNETLAKDQLPGCVVLVARNGKIAFRKAYGLRSKQPEKSEMTVETLFDMASLTKPIATATSCMLLIERGKLNVKNRVAQHIPEFGNNGKEDITVEQLLIHTSGLVADNALQDYQDGPAKAMERIHQLKPRTPPGGKFVYSDVGYIVLGEIIARLSGESLDGFTRKEIFEPLGMVRTGFKPSPALASLAAPTERREGQWMQGQVHDPRAHLLGGVAGHAGLFSVADEVAVYAQMLLNHGEYGGKRILQPETVKLMTAPRTVPGGLRTYGWDMETSYSGNRGDRFSTGSFGHTGFTGTSLWVDPGSQTAIIFLSNRMHPDGKGNVTRLRGQVASIVAEAMIPPLPLRKLARPGQTMTGIDVMKRDGFRLLKGRKIGLVTNHTGVDREGNTTIDLLHQAEGVTLVALFSPEHGIRGQLDAKVGDGKDEKTGLPIYSLYGDRRKPVAEQLKGIDTLVYDIQDIGCRFYTYSATLGLILESAAENKLKVVVLDRPNPIGGLAVEGPVLDAGKETFTGFHTIPVRHGMTFGELARLFNVERKINADLEVVKLEGWQRSDMYDRTGLTWINPSPNMRSLAAALLYPGVGLLETTNLSVGRGTDRPFEMIGAPWMDGPKLAAALNAANLPGVTFVPVRFTPNSSVHANKLCGGVQIFLTDWQRFESLPVGMTIACALKKLFPDDWQTKRYHVLLVDQATLDAVEGNQTPEQIQALWLKELEQFLAVRKKYLLYE